MTTVMILCVLALIWFGVRAPRGKRRARYEA
jgi:hypothetical protein